MDDKKTNNALGKNLRQLRLRQGLRQSDVAANLGVDADTYGRWEMGWELPPNDYMPQLAKLYGADAKDLFFAAPGDLLSLRPEAIRKLLDCVPDPGVQALLRHELAQQEATARSH